MSTHRFTVTRELTDLVSHDELLWRGIESLRRLIHDKTVPGSTVRAMLEATEVRISPGTRNLGHARWIRSQNRGVIHLGRRFFLDRGNFDAHLDGTMAHEAAHIAVAHVKKPRGAGGSHGLAWKLACVAMGGDGRATFSGPLNRVARSRRQERLVARCVDVAREIQRLRGELEVES